MRGRWVVAGTAALVAVGGIALLSGLLDWRSEGAVASLESLREREVIYLEDEHVFLVYNDGDLLALSDDSQHVGDRVVFCESSQMFESPAHGEKFDIEGRYFGGPAERGLDRYPVRIEGDGVYVDLDEPIQGPDRGGPALREPQGPFCKF